MTRDEPIELLEAQRLIRAKQSRRSTPESKPDESLEDACERLAKRFKNVPQIPNSQADERERQMTVEKLRMVWNAPTRHVSRVILDPEAKEWFRCFEKMEARLGTGFTAALVGKRGPGKTQLAVELMKTETTQMRAAYYCTAMDYFMRIKDTFQPDRKESQADAQKFFSRPKLLVIDEVNVRSDSPWEDNMLSDLIGKRYNAVLDTVLISNESLVNFEQSIGPSIIDRLNETGGIVECNWKSFRQ